MEITGEYWLGVVPIDLNRSTPHFGFFSEFPSAIVAVTKLNENCYNVFTQFLLFLLYLPQDEIRVLSSELMGGALSDWWWSFGGKIEPTKSCL